MITLIATLLGFVSSSFPDVLKYWKDRADRKHELAILDKQMQAQQQGHTQRLAEIEIQADMAESKALYANASQPSGVKWVEGMRASVRPIITYVFFGLFVFIKVMSMMTLIKQGFTTTDSLIVIWDEETRALFAAVMAFWFGQRAVLRARHPH